MRRSKLYFIALLATLGALFGLASPAMAASVATYTWNLTSLYTNPDSVNGTFAYNNSNYTTHWQDGSWRYDCTGLGDQPSGVGRAEVLICVGVNGTSWKDALFIHNLNNTVTVDAEFTDAVLGTNGSWYTCAGGGVYAAAITTGNKDAYACFGATQSGTTGQQVQSGITWFHTVYGSGNTSGGGTQGTGTPIILASPVRTL